MGAVTIKTISDTSFDAEVLEASGPVLVYYWNESCGSLAYLSQIAEDYSGRLTVATLNVDENTRTAARYGVSEVPLLMLFKHDKNYLSGACHE